MANGASKRGGDNEKKRSLCDDEEFDYDMESCVPDVERQVEKSFFVRINFISLT